MGSLTKRKNYIRHSLDKLIQEHQKIAMSEMALLVVEHSGMSRKEMMAMVERIDKEAKAYELKNLPHSYDKELKTKVCRRFRSALFNSEYREDLPL